MLTTLTTGFEWGKNTIILSWKSNWSCFIKFKSWWSKWIRYTSSQRPQTTLSTFIIWFEGPGYWTIEMTEKLLCADLNKKMRKCDILCLDVLTLQIIKWKGDQWMGEYILVQLCKWWMCHTITVQMFLFFWGGLCLSLGLSCLFPCWAVCII